MTTTPANRLEGRVAIVTGSSRGIGERFARRFAAEGASVVVTAREEPAFPGTPEEVASAIVDAGGTAVPVTADLRIQEERERIVAAAVDAFGRVDILVNNAAVSYYGAIEDVPPKRLRLMYEVQVEAPYALATAVLAGMRERGEGWILNVTSKIARHPAGPPYASWAHPGPAGGELGYGMMKAALDRFSTGLAAELYGTGIRVNALGTSGLVPSPGAAFLGWEAGDDFVVEREGTIESAAAALCSGPPELTGVITYSEEFFGEGERSRYFSEAGTLILRPPYPLAWAAAGVGPRPSALVK